jgi:dipeptidyl aminopeptidase/acylaminoacyl peptidase
MKRLKLAVLAGAMLVSPVMAQQAPAPEVRQVGTARLENVPEIPADVREAVQRYQNSRSAEFEDWLADGTMLIRTRFGTSNQLHHVAAPGASRQQLTFFASPVAGATAIPGTQRFVMIRDTDGDEWFQLHVRGLTGASVQLTEPGTRSGSPVVSEDGRMLVWTTATKGSAAYTLNAADLTAAQPTPRALYKADGAIGASDLSADKSRVLFTRSLSNRESQMLVLDNATGRAARIAPNAPPARYDSPRFLADGKTILAISDRDSDVRRLVEIDIASGRERVLTPDLKWNVEGYDLSKGGRVLAYVVNEDGFSRVVVQDRITRRALPQPELPRGVVSALKFSPQGDRLAIGLSSATSAGDVWAWDVAGGGLTRWTTSELGDLDPADLAEPELIRFKSFDGLSVPAFVYRPKNVPAGQRTPVIMDIHGGPEAQSLPSWNYGAQYFADTLGATVILPNVRGSDGYGKRYLNLDNAEKREDSVRDIGALLDWIETQPGLDASKVAVYGQSYGGYMSLAVMTHYSDRLVGGVNRYGISDFVTFLERTEAYRRDNRRAEYGDERDPEMRKVFARIAPMANIAKITKPMLVMQGATDPRVPQFESDQVVAKLRANGIETWYVLFSDEGHGFQKKENNDLRREVETVFLRKLFAGE